VDVVGSSPIARSNFFSPRFFKSLFRFNQVGQEPVGKGSGKQEFSRIFLRGHAGGSSPATRSVVRRPIARSIFSSLQLFLLFFISAAITLPALSQVEEDASRSFGQGEVVLLPGTSSYLGDLPHEVKIVSSDSPFHTLTGQLAAQTGWFHPTNSSAIGFSALPVGLLFEGLPCPLPSAKILEWVTAGQKTELLQFPAQAWWGPKAAAGAVQLKTRPFRDKAFHDFSLWAGTGGIFGGENFLNASNFVLEGNYRHGKAGGIIDSDNLEVLSKIRWVKTDTTSVENGFLALQQVSGDYWYSFFGDIRLSSGNFQSFQLKPYFQTARSGNQEAREGGGQISYHLNMAGLAEGHLGAGFTQGDVESGSGSTETRAGFLQVFGLLDALGPLTADWAFRLDFSNMDPDAFSALVGLQSVQGDFVFFGNYGKGVLDTAGEDAQVFELGFRHEPHEQWSFGAKYLHQRISSDVFNGGRAQVQFANGGPVLGLFRKIKVRLEEQLLASAAGLPVYDTGGLVEFALFPRSRFWVRGRVLSNAPLYLEAGGEWSFTERMRIYLAAANFNNPALAWPDPDLSLGSVVWAGIQGSF
jgi:hypothetical protein